MLPSDAISMVILVSIGIMQGSSKTMIWNAGSVYICLANICSNAIRKENFTILSCTLYKYTVYKLRRLCLSESERKRFKWSWKRARITSKVIAETCQWFEVSVFFGATRRMVPFALIQNNFVVVGHDYSQTRWYRCEVQSRKCSTTILSLVRHVFDAEVRLTEISRIHLSKLYFMLVNYYSWLEDAYFVTRKNTTVRVDSNHYKWYSTRIQVIVLLCPWQELT